MSTNDKIVFENDAVRVTITGNDYDFIGSVENKTDEPIAITPSSPAADDDKMFTPFIVPANDWIGIMSDDDGKAIMKAASEKEIVVCGRDELELVDNAFGTSLEDECGDRSEER